MKTIGTIIATIVLIPISLAAYDYWNDSNTLTKGEFNDYKEEFRAEIDSLKKNQVNLLNNQDLFFANQDTIKSDINTLKAGQAVIYKQIKEKSNDSYFDKLQKFIQQ